MSRTRPDFPLPPPLRGNETGTWAHSTITVRLPEIARRALAENELPAAARAAIEALIAEIPARPIRPLPDQSAPDREGWAAAIAPVAGRDWLSVPWFFAETYFYRRIVAAVDFFHGGLDPFRYQKTQGLANSWPAIRALAQRVAETRRSADPEMVLSILLAVSLWGNQADLSLWPAGDETQPDHAEEETQSAYLLVDDRPGVLAHMNQPAITGFIDIIIDNAGYELVTDLFLIDFLLHDRDLTVRAHAKLHPTFVSDATEADVVQTVAALAEDPDPLVAAMGRRLLAARAAGRFELTAHPFWTSPRPGWAMPTHVRDQLSTSSLVIAKGDANYRRLLGDRHWAATAPFAAILAYFPAPLVALRTVKAQLIAGLPPGQAEDLRRRDPDWMTNGRWGMIQAMLP